MLISFCKIASFTISQTAKIRSDVVKEVACVSGDKLMRRVSMMNRVMLCG